MHLFFKRLATVPALAIFLLISCKKNDNPTEFQYTRVKSANDADGSINYTYDTKWRLIKYDARSKADTNLREYMYTDTTVTVRNYYGNNIYHGTILYKLNARGLAVSMIDSSTSTNHTYTYNSHNQLLQLQVTSISGGITYHWDNKYYYNDNEDLDSTSTWASATGLTTPTYYPQYDLTNTTTIGSDNVGLSFLGSASKHPLKQTTASNGTVLFNYAYTYDSRKRVASQQTNVGEVFYKLYSFTYY